jgi:hypothetical protein
MDHLVKMDDFAGELHVLLSTLVMDHLVKMDDFAGELHVLQVNLSRNKQ